MQIVTQTETGGPEVLQLVEAPLPEPGPGEVRLRVAAAGVNPVDAFVRMGAAPILGNPPFTLGWDMAGHIDALGAEVRRLAVGDRVMGLVRFPSAAGAYAEAAIAPADQLARVPDALSDEEAGALPLAGLTAWQALVRHGRLMPGERVLIHAGAGGVGHLAVQIAHALGAEVTTTVSAAKAGTARELGATRTIDYRNEDFTAAGPFDLILDHAGGEHLDRSLSALREGGRVVTLRAPSDEAASRATAEGKSLTHMTVAPDRAGLEALGALAEDGKLRVLVAERYPLSRAAEAHAALTRSPLGKIVLRPGAS